MMGLNEFQWWVILGLSFLAIGLCCLAVLIIMLIEDRKEEEKYRKKGENGRNKTTKN